jgi:hypothetical protein
MKNEKMFKADYNKQQYKIEIIICENGSLFYVEKINKDFTITYDSLIGALEITKINLIKDQSGENRKTYKKQVKPKTKK